MLDHNGGTESSAITSLVLTQMPPVVSSVTPSHGLASGGTTVTITGAYFSHVAAVNFGANNPATIISSTPTTIVVTSPPGAVGAVDVVVSTRQGTSAASTADQFTYLVVPSSTVAALPTYSPASFPVTWSGHVDSTLHIAYYDIYVSDNNGDFAIWQSHTTLTSAIFTGQDSHHYGFYSVATDSAGDVEPAPSGAQASTTVDAVPPPAPSVRFRPTLTRLRSQSSGAAPTALAPASPATRSGSRTTAVRIRPGSQTRLRSRPLTRALKGISTASIASPPTRPATSSLWWPAATLPAAAPHTTDR